MSNFFVDDLHDEGVFAAPFVLVTAALLGLGVFVGAEFGVGRHSGGGG